MSEIASARINTPPPYKPPSKLTQSIITWLFSRSIKRGRLVLQFPNKTIEVGVGKLVCTIAPPNFLRLLWMMLKPDYRLPSHYTSGYWCCQDKKLYEFLELLTVQTKSPLQWWFRFWNRSPFRDHIVYKLFPIKVKEQIAKHYNTDPAFMRLILGKHLEYTCAFFETAEESLYDAQERKVQTVIKRLAIGNSDRVLDMGCGWGQIAEAVSAATGVQVTGLNITPNQISYAKSQSSAGTRFILNDYEAYSPEEKFSKIYSIGMLEHIGRGKLDCYFHKISELLREDGLALVHCIVRTKEGSTNSWIDREVFPGAYIPQLSEIVKSIDRSPLHIEAIYTHDRRNYFRTLSAWTQNLYANWENLIDILQQRIPEQDARLIMRIWEFYLSSSRLAFNSYNGYCYNVQITLSCQKRDQPEHLSL